MFIRNHGRIRLIEDRNDMVLSPNYASLDFLEGTYYVPNISVISYFSEDEFGGIGGILSVRLYGNKTPDEIRNIYNNPENSALYADAEIYVHYELRLDTAVYTWDHLVAKDTPITGTPTKVLLRDDIYELFYNKNEMDELFVKKEALYPDRCYQMLGYHKALHEATVEDVTESSNSSKLHITNTDNNASLFEDILNNTNPHLISYRMSEHVKKYGPNDRLNVDPLYRNNVVKSNNDNWAPTVGIYWSALHRHLGGYSLFSEEKTTKLSDFRGSYFTITTNPNLDKIKESTTTMMNGDFISSKTGSSSRETPYMYYGDWYNGNGNGSIYRELNTPYLSRAIRTPDKLAGSPVIYYGASMPYNKGKDTGLSLGYVEEVSIDSAINKDEDYLLYHEEGEGDYYTKISPLPSVTNINSFSIRKLLGRSTPPIVSLSTDILNTDAIDKFKEYIKVNNIPTAIRLGDEVTVTSDNGYANRSTPQGRANAAHYITPPGKQYALTSLELAIDTTKNRYNNTIAYNATMGHSTDFPNMINARKNLNPNNRLAIDKVVAKFRPIQAKRNGVWEDIK